MWVSYKIMSEKNNYIIEHKNIILNQIKKEEVSFGAIYFLLKDNKIVYIGQTTKGITRIESHIQEQSKKFDSYSIFKIDKDLLDDFEIENILHYKPIYNNNYLGTKYATISTINTQCRKIFGSRQMKIIKTVIKDLEYKNKITLKKINYNDDKNIELIMKNDINLIISEVKKHIKY